MLIGLSRKTGSGNMNTKDGFTTKFGNVLPFKEWHDIGHGFSIMPMKTRHKLRFNETGETHQPSFKIGPGNDSLMMALYREQFPVEYAAYCFGYDLLEQQGVDTA